MTSAELCPVQAKDGPAQMETSNIVHDIVSDIVYYISYNNTDIVYDIDIRYSIPITMEYYVLVLSYVYIVPVIYLNSLLKGYPRTQVESVPSEEWEGSPKPGRGLLD
jgi:hypothetical protein